MGELTTVRILVATKDSPGLIRLHVLCPDEMACCKCVTDVL